MKSFEVGQEVYLSRESKYWGYTDSLSNPKYTKGVVARNKYGIEVEWSNNNWNVYSPNDLTTERPSQFHKVIGCAANLVEIWKDGKLIDTLVVADNCHFGKNMQQIFRTFEAVGCEVKQIHRSEGQGFLDESGNYLTRSEAYKIASTSGQLFNPEYVLPGNELDSSCIRHFSADKPIEVYSELWQKN